MANGKEKENEGDVDDVEEEELDIPSLDVKDPDLCTDENLSAYIDWWMQEQHDQVATDKRLLSEFRTDFADWNTKIFNTAKKSNKILRNFLRCHGVFVYMADRSSIAENLNATLTETGWHEWTKEELEQQEAYFPKATFESSVNKLPRGERRAASKVAAQMAALTIDGKKQKTTKAPKTKNTPAPKTKSTTALSNHSDSSSDSSDSDSDSDDSNATASTTSKKKKKDKDYTKQYNYLEKACREDMQYGGGEDPLDLHLQLFYRICKRYKLPRDGWAEAFPIFLKGDAREYYLTTIAPNPSAVGSFDVIKYMLETYFQTDELKNKVLDKWNAVSLAAIVQKNPKESTLECFETLDKDLRKWRLQLPDDWRSDSMICARLNSACRDMEECAWACQDPPKTYQALAAKICTSIATKERIAGRSKKSYGTFLTNGEDDEDGDSDDDDEDGDQFYGDRIFRGKNFRRQSNNQRARFPPRTTQKRFPQKQIEQASTKNLSDYKGKCICCGEHGCHSSKHSKEEREKAWKQFGNVYKNKFGKYPSSAYLQRWTERIEGTIPRMDNASFLQEMAGTMEEEGKVDERPSATHLTTSCGTVDGAELVQYLQDNTARHILTRKIPIQPTSKKSINARYGSTFVKPYYEDADKNEDVVVPPDKDYDEDPDIDAEEVAHRPVTRGMTNRDLPPEANIDIPQEAEEQADEYPNEAIPPQKRGRGRPRKHPRPEVFLTIDKFEEDRSFYVAVEDGETTGAAYLSSREISDRELSLKLRAAGIIKTPGKPFETARKKEIDGLLAKEVYEAVPYDFATMSGIRLFKSRFVEEIKGKTTDAPYEKVRFIVQGHSDMGKHEVLTQSPTIQRMSYRLLLALAPMLIVYFACTVYLRDIIQAYTASESFLRRCIICIPPKELGLPEGWVIIIRKPLYGVPEAGNHWFKTYSDHHTIKLGMKQSTFDACLHMATGKDEIGLHGVQTDDTFMIHNEKFATRETQEMAKASFESKPRVQLQLNKPEDFNGGLVTLEEGNSITLIPKDQPEKIKLVDINANVQERTAEYVAQRARCAYIAALCQPEALYDSSVAAQAKEPADDDIRKLNKRLQWQLDNKTRGLRYIPMNPKKMNLYIFVDGSFAS